MHGGVWVKEWTDDDPIDYIIVDICFTYEDVLKYFGIEALPVSLLQQVQDRFANRISQMYSLSIGYGRVNPFDVDSWFVKGSDTTE